MEEITEEDRREILMDLDDLIDKWKKRRIIIRYAIDQNYYSDLAKITLSLRKFSEKDL